jgi:LmbE family N-acetylglucosaminyl deacetylase
MRTIARTARIAATTAILAPWHHATAQSAAPRTLVAVFAHADDETMVAPVLARYAREGVAVYQIFATDGAQGGAHTDIPRGPELARVRAEEAGCSARALGVHAPILLGFPDAKLGDYGTDPSTLYRLTQRLAEELERLRPDAIISFGPDGATGHPDHRLVGGLVTQLVRAGAPGVPERLFYAWIPAEGMQAMNPRGAPPMLVPQTRYVSARVPVTPADLDAARRAMACHRTQYSPEIVQLISALQARTWAGAVPLAPAFSTAPGTDLFR